MASAAQPGLVRLSREARRRLTRVVADDERRWMRPQSPAARSVAAAWRRLHRRRSSTMARIDFVAAPRIYRHGARNATGAITRKGS